MRIAPYWERRVHRVAGMTFRVRAFSFCSAQEAHERMLAKLQLLSDFYGSSHHGEDSLSRFRHSLRELDEQNNPESYSVVTTEQILQCMDEQNIITRNRYGVQVLNTSSLCILDVDSFLRPWKQRLLALFGGGRALNPVCWQLHAVWSHETSGLVCACTVQLEGGVSLLVAARLHRMIAVPSLCNPLCRWIPFMHDFASPKNAGEHGSLQSPIAWVCPAFSLSCPRVVN